MKKLFVTSVLFLIYFSISPIHAHTTMTDSNPQKNSVVQEMPDKLWIEFAEDLLVIDEKKINGISVIDSQGNIIDKVDSKVSGARVTVSLKDQVTAGKITVSYRVAANDGHVLTDEFSFLFKPLPEATNSAEPISSATSIPEEPIENGSELTHANHGNGFFKVQMHHILQVAFAISIIFLWWVYQRRK